MVQDRKKAIVIGASSGIGRALTKVLSSNGYIVGLAARRVELLKDLQKELPAPSYIKRIDVSRQEEAMTLLEELIEQMGGLDLIVLNSGINTHNAALSWQGEIETINVNVSGFVAMANIAVKHFLAQDAGQIVGISSIAALRGSASCPAYNASKAFVVNYLQGLRYRFHGHNNIYVTDIRPGLVDTAMVRGQPRLFWVAQADGAAKQIFQAIRQKRKIAYITRRWSLIAWLLQVLPDWLLAWRYSCNKNKHRPLPEEA